uniref:Reverse transcriptase domain-containing protein n=1 Tax=Astatotilapia calliptera TaxID=8154 RepID=A0AAX7SJH0_ASTCA
MKTITGFRPTNSRGAEGGENRADELNLFFNRFDTTVSAPTPTTSPAVSLESRATPLCQPLSSHVASCEIPDTPPPPITFTQYQVEMQMRRLRSGKSAGPDGVSPLVLKACAPQLCGVFHKLFMLSLSLQRFPVMWKTSCLVPVPKTPRPSGPQDYRPVALTSHIMKTLERLILDQLRPIVRPQLDPLQFAYQPRLGTEDAIIYLLNRVYTHLDQPASTVRVMFFDFSSAFNTIRPTLLGDKLAAMQVDASLVSWIVDYLTGRPQYVRVSQCVSDKVISNTGAPQGTVLSPFLFTLYTTDFSHCTETCHLQKFSDDSAVVGCISRDDETEYRAVVDSFVTWCEQNHLQLNVAKTKELIVDFRKTRKHLTPVSIQGVSVDIVEDYKYLGVHIDNKLDWAKNTTALYRKGQSRLYFLRRLRSFNICQKMLRIFYESVVASAILYAVACWGSRLRVADANRLNKLIRKASNVVGMELDSLKVVSERRMLSKIKTMLDNTSHPLHDMLVSHRSSFSERLRLPMMHH